MADYQTMYSRATYATCLLINFLNKKKLDFPIIFWQQFDPFFNVRTFLRRRMIIKSLQRLETCLISRSRKDTGTSFWCHFHLFCDFTPMKEKSLTERPSLSAVSPHAKHWIIKMLFRLNLTIKILVTGFLDLLFWIYRCPMTPDSYSVLSLTKIQKEINRRKKRAYSSNILRGESKSKRTESALSFEIQ